MLIELGSKLVQGTVAEHDTAGQAGSRERCWHQCRAGHGRIGDHNSLLPVYG
jgi:hypothetical protein